MSRMPAPPADRSTLSIFVQALCVTALLVLARGWLFMLAVGLVHHEWIPALPTIGYAHALLLAFLLSAALNRTDGTAER